MSAPLERFARVVADAPDAVLIEAPGEERRLTARGLAEEAVLVGRALADAGLGAGDLVASLTGNRAGFFALVVAALGDGPALLPLDRATPLVEAEAIAARFGASALVVPTLLAQSDSRLMSVAGAHVALPGGLTLVRRPDTVARGSVRGAAVLKLTSGSSGLPKATFTTADNLDADGLAIVEAMDIRPHDWQLGLIPISHSYGLGNIVMPLLQQGTRVVLRDTFVPAYVRDDAAASGARVFAGVPFMFEHLLTHLAGSAWPGSLETLISAGARLDPATARSFAGRFGRRIHSFYGASETGGIAYDAIADPEAPSPTVGAPLPRVRIAVRAVEEAPGDGGRVHVSGPAVSRGYVGASVDEADAFVDGGFLTGDLGYLDAHGRLVLTGRVSAFVNVAGRKVPPGEVERVLLQMPGIADVRVLGAPDPRRGQQLVACVVVRDAGLRAVDLREHCARQLAAYKIPRAFLFLDAMPVDERGKVSRRALEALVAERLRGPDAPAGSGRSAGDG